MRSNRSVRLLSVFLICLLLAAVATAQTVTGTLNGRVLDATGAVIPNIKVVATGEATGLVRENITNQEGYYLLSFLPIGQYRVVVSAPGFKTVTKTGVVIQLNQATVSDFHMQPAVSTEVVNVTGEAPLIETQAGDVKRTLTEKAIENIPLSGRNFLSLATVVPGFQLNAASGQNNSTLSSGSSVNINGTGTRGATFQVDGVNNDDSSENQNRQNINPATIAQVQVLTNNFSAEFGRGYGAVVLAQTKQGTNQFHGEGYWYHQNNALSALDWFTTPGTKVVSNRRHEFGGTLGGPIVANKLFFFGSFNGVRSGGSQTYTRDILLPSERHADLNATMPSSAGYTDADRKWVQSIINRFPDVLPNNPTKSLRAYTTGISTHYPVNDYTGRVDWNIDTNNSFSSRYQYTHNTNAADDVIIGEQTESDYLTQNIGGTWTHIYSNTQTGEFRFGLGRRATVVDLAAGSKVPIVRFSNSPYSGTILGNAGAYPIKRYQTDWQYVYNHNWMITPKITLKAGTDIRLQQLNDFADNNSRGLWYFGNVADSVPNAKTDPNINNWVANAGPYYDFIHGTANSFSTAYGPFQLGNRNKEFNFYQQADIKVSPSFTLNLGAREEYVRSPREVNNLVDYIYGDQIAVAPRIGFAYSPQTSGSLLSLLTGGPGKMSIHGGFGITTGRLFQSYFSQSGASVRINPPNAASKGFTRSEITHVSDPTNGFVFTPGWPTSRVGYTEIDPDMVMPYTEQWNFTVERELPWQMGLSVGYVGNRGIGLPFYDIINRAQWGSGVVGPNVNYASWKDPVTGKTVNNQNVPFTCISNNSNTAPAPGCISLKELRANDRRADSHFSGVFVLRNGAWSYYNGLQVQVTKKTSHGLFFQANYTWSKSIDTGSESTSTGIDVNAPITQNAQAAALRGLSLFDNPHRFTINYAYELPILKQQKGWVGKAFGGWTLSGVTELSSGNPFTVVAGYDRNGDGVGGDRPDIYDRSILGRSIDNPKLAMNTCQTDAAGNPIISTCLQVGQTMLPATAFMPAGALVFTGTTAQINAAYDQRPFTPDPNFVGTLGRNTFRSDGQANFNAMVSKSFPFTESQKLVVRWEVYNVMNHAQFGLPNRDVTTATFGKITSQRNSPRFMQFAFRYIF